MGFYTNKADYTAIKNIHIGTQLPVDQQVHFTVLRSDSPAFTQLLGARRQRSGAWFVAPLPTHIDPCYITPQFKSSQKDKA